MRAGLIFGLAACSLPALAYASPTIELESPRDRTKLRGAPALLEVAVAPSGARALEVEVDGRARAAILPWRRGTELALEPGIHRVAVRGRDPATGEQLRSDTALVVVFPEQARRIDPRRRHALTALAAFVVAVLGAAALRRRGW